MRTCSRLIFIILVLFFNYNATQETVKWCSVSAPEQNKCLALADAIASQKNFISKYNLSCIQGISEFDCMSKVSNFEADLVNLDAGLGYYASRRFSLRPVAVENYNETYDNMNNAELKYFAAVVVPKSKGNVDPYLLRSKEICFAGAGTADGYVMQLSKLIGSMKAIPVVQCNSVVQNLISYLGFACLPGSLNEIFNPFGDNTDEICRLCNDKGLESYCTFNDKYARNEGALKCLFDHNNNTETKLFPTAAFVRAREIELAALNDKYPSDQFQLLCPNKDSSGIYTAPLTSWNTCNWGEIPSRMIMTSLTRNDVSPLQGFMQTLITVFGTSPGPFNINATPLNAGTTTSPFNLFSSANYTSTANPYPKRNLMFSDFTRSIYVPAAPLVATFDIWIENLKSNFMTDIDQLNQCPLPTTRWCVIDEWEMKKCQDMRSAFMVKGIKPDLDCVLSKTTNDCMRLIKEGYADLVNLEAGDLYTAGKYFGLVPIISEQYGIGPYYYAVAVARKVEPNLLISNWKYTKTCHSGVGRGTGWVVPMNIILDTVQVRVLNGRLIHSYGELLSRACIPGILNEDYNPDNTNSLNLCESCIGGNADKCHRDNRELYFGETGAYRCLVEGSDIAFTRHTTVHRNTAGRNPNYWARNQREDDYELLCPDGQRKDVDKWKVCHLAKIPSNTIVTASYKTENQRLNMWRMLQYGQEFYSADVTVGDNSHLKDQLKMILYGQDYPINELFAMFNSDFYHADLLFSDDTDSLEMINWEDQDYIKWLGTDFLRLIENIEAVSLGTSSGIYNKASPAKNFRIHFVILSSIIVIFLALKIS